MKSIILLATILSLLPGLSAPAQTVTDYCLFTGWGTLKNSGEDVIILRRFLKGNAMYYLTVPVQTLNTGIIGAELLEVRQASWQAIKTKFAASPYIRLLEKAGKLDLPMQDAGIRSFSSSREGIDLTIDLCPSHRPLDRIIFTDLINELGRIEKPVPLAISITGKWMNTHPKDLLWLDSLEKAGLLDIVWINHTYNHNVSKNAPLRDNFLLEPGTDINTEVLKIEAALIEKNMVPSVFFRFPGLVSDKTIYDKIINYGLIPVGSDAWLAKGQQPGKGSIVLIHGNGNEPLGIKDFISLLHREQPNVLSGKWELFDLRESVMDEEIKQEP